MFLETGELAKRPTEQEVKAMIILHTRLQLEYKGEYIGIREMRKHVSWYITGYKNAARLRGEINKAQTIDELLSCVNKIF